jgi:hypothetical protein
MPSSETPAPAFGDCPQARRKPGETAAIRVTEAARLPILCLIAVSAAFPATADPAPRYAHARTRFHFAHHPPTPCLLQKDLCTGACIPILRYQRQADFRGARREPNQWKRAPDQRRRTTRPHARARPSPPPATNGRIVSRPSVGDPRPRQTVAACLPHDRRAAKAACAATAPGTRAPLLRSGETGSFPSPDAPGAAPGQPTI